MVERAVSDRGPSDQSGARHGQVRPTYPSVPADFSAAPPTSSPSPVELLRLQRSAGNAAVANLLTRNKPPSVTKSAAVQRKASITGRQPTGAEATVQRQPPSPGNTAAPAPAPVGEGQQPQAPLGPSGPLGEVEFSLPNVNIADRKDTPKHWEKQVTGARVLTIPIPDVPVTTVSVGAMGKVFADFNAFYGPIQLQNLRVGMSKQQAIILAAGALSPIAAPVAGALAAPISPIAGIGLAVFGGPAARIAALYTLYKGPFKARAELSTPVGGMVRFGAAAGLTIDAELAAKYSILSLDAGVEGAVELNLNLTHPEGPNVIDITYENADLDFHKTLELAANLKMEMMLSAFIHAQVLGKWDWASRWNMARTPVDKTWPLTPRLIIDNKRGGGGAAPQPGANPMANSIIGSIGDTEVELTLGKDSPEPSADDAAEFLRLALGGRKPDEVKKDPLAPDNRGGEPGKPPRNREPLGTASDPILISWYKAPHWYLDPIQLDVGRGREDFRRDRTAMLPNNQAIGVRRWPRIGEVFQLHGVPTPRSGSEQAAFRQTLERYGFNWRGWDADHVWDLGLEGFDDFTNLWPLESGVNQRAGTWQLGQGVKYNLEGDPPDARRPIKAINGNPDLVGKYFKIRDFKEPT